MENTISGYVISIAPRLVMNDVVHRLRREGSRPSRSKGMYLYRIKRVGGEGGGESAAELPNNSRDQMLHKVVRRWVPKVRAARLIFLTRKDLYAQETLTIRPEPDRASKLAARH